MEAEAPGPVDMTQPEFQPLTSYRAYPPEEMRRMLSLEAVATFLEGGMVDC